MSNHKDDGTTNINFFGILPILLVLIIIILFAFPFFIDMNSNDRC